MRRSLPADRRSTRDQRNHSTHDLPPKTPSGQILGLSLLFRRRFPDQAFASPSSQKIPRGRFFDSFVRAEFGGSKLASDPRSTRDQPPQRNHSPHHLPPKNSLGADSSASVRRLYRPITSVLFWLGGCGIGFASFFALGSENSSRVVHPLLTRRDYGGTIALPVQKPLLDDLASRKGEFGG